MSGIADSSSTTALLIDSSDGLNTVKTTVASPKTYEDYYIMRPNAVRTDDLVRVVATYDPSAGSFTPDNPWHNAPAAVEPYELHGLLEPENAATDCINEALERIWIPVEATFTPTPLATRHLMSTEDTSAKGRSGLMPFLRDEAQVRQVGYLVSGQSRDQWDPYQQTVYGYARSDGQNFYLHHPSKTFNATDIVYVLALVRAYDWCSSLGSTTFGSTDGGINSETDLALPSLDWVTAGALVVAWRRFAHILEPTANQRLIKDAAAAAAWFTNQTDLHFRKPPLTFRSLSWFGPLPSGSWPY